MTKRFARPTGRSVAEYAGYTEWTFQRWAWEFLRRNPDFQKACRDAGEDNTARKRVAEQFGLKKFVRYQFEKKRPSWAPKFVAATVDKWSWVKKRKKAPVLKLAPGDVVLRFRLAATALDPAALEAQLADARQFLLQRQQEHLQALDLDRQEVVQAAKPTYFLRNLRLIDLLDGKGVAQCEPGRALHLLHARPKSLMTDAEALSRYRKQINQARSLSKSGYLLVAGREGVPSPGKFETADISHPVIR